MALDLHKLEHLVAVAEEGSFTRAARRLHISQQALSTSIRVLEREVGVPLLDRSGPSVTPLPAGASLIEDARVLRGMARAALRRARRTGRAQGEVLRIGHTPAVTVEEVLALLHEVRRVHPDLATEVNQRYPAELTAELLADELDLGLCRALPAGRGLTSTTVASDRLRVAVRAGHPLAERATLALADLADHRLVVWGTPGQSGYTDLLIGHCRRAGFEPRVVRNPLQGTPPVSSVVGTDDVALVTAPAGPAVAGAVQVLDLEPAIHAPLLALWPEHVRSEARNAFLAAPRRT